MTLLAWLSTAAALAQTVIWSGAAADKQWSTAGNWDLGYSPTNGNAVVFGDVDVTGTPGLFGTINNIVNANTVIGSLAFTNTANAVADQVGHTTQIPSGKSLYITNSGGNAIFVGTGTATNTYLYETIVGDGLLVVSNTTGTINLKQGCTTPAGGKIAQLDMTELANFNCDVTNIFVAGDGGSLSQNNRLAGTLILAKTNIIRCYSGSADVNITIGRNVANANIGTGDVQLGETNVFLCDGGIAASYGKSNGSMEFNTTGLGALGLVNPTAYFRNSAGTGRQAFWEIGDDYNGRQSGTRVGTFDFSAGSVDAMVDSMIIGRGQNSSAGGGVIGTLSYGGGIIDVNNVTVGSRAVSGSGTRIGGVGTLNVNNAQLIVNNNLQLAMGFGHVPEAVGDPQGTLNVTGGSSVWVKGNVVCGTENLDGATGFGNISVANSSLKVGGTLGTASVGSGVGGINNLTLDTSALTLTITPATSPSNPAANVTNLTINSALTLNVQGGVSTVGQYPLIAYSGTTILGGGFAAVTLGTLPSRTLGYLSNNVAASSGSIDLVVTNVASARWEGNVTGGDWDVNNTANWQDTRTLASTKYQEVTPPGDSTLFDDNATGTTTVNLTTTLSPASVTVTNDTKTYVFKGPGALGSSSACIQKFGSGTLIITNSGANAFPGTMGINGGTVKLGLAANRLPTLLNVALADVSGALLDLGDQNQTIGTLSGGGASGGNVNLGAGTLTVSAGGTYSGVISGAGAFVKAGSGTLLLPAAQLYGGGTTLSGSGGLIVDNPSGNGTGTGAVTIGAGTTLTIGQYDLAGSVASSALITNNGALVLTRNDLSTFGNTIVGSGTLYLLETNFNTVSLTGANTYSGGTVVGASALRVSNPNVLGTGYVYVENTTGTAAGPSSVLQVVGGITITNELDLDQKNAGQGVVPAVENISGHNTFSGPVVMFIGGSYWRIQSDAGKVSFTGPVQNTSAGTGRYLDFIGAGDGEWLGGLPAGPAGGTTGLAVDSSGTWTLGGVSDYVNATQINSGTLIVNGKITASSGVEVFAGATLGGTGVISAPITVDPSGMLSPGASIGTLTCSNVLTLSTGSTNIFEVNGDTLACDRVIGMTSVSYGGDLKIVILGGESALTNKAAIKLFDALAYSGGFDTIEPATPGPGRVWDTSTLTTDGTLRVIAFQFDSIARTGPTAFQLSGSSGAIADGTGYRVFAQTNVTLPFLQWFQVGSGTFASGAFSLTDNTATNGQRFYRIVSP